MAQGGLPAYLITRPIKLAIPKPLLLRTDEWKVPLHVISLPRVHVVSLHPVSRHVTASSQAAVAAIRAPYPLVAALTRNREVSAFVGTNLKTTQALPALSRSIHVLTPLEQDLGLVARRVVAAGGPDCLEIRQEVQGRIFLFVFEWSRGFRPLRGGARPRSNRTRHLH